MFVTWTINQYFIFKYRFFLFKKNNLSIDNIKFFFNEYSLSDIQRSICFAVHKNDKILNSLNDFFYQQQFIEKPPKSKYCWLFIFRIEKIIHEINQFSFRFFCFCFFYPFFSSFFFVYCCHLYCFDLYRDKKKFC